MHLKGTDLNLLVALEALLTEKSVTLAAERLHVTQPAMSNALKRIRDRFGDEILVRNGRSLELTPAAQTMIFPLQEILAQAEALLNVGSAFDPMTARKTFRIMMSDYCADILLPPISKALSQLAPNIKCEVDFLNNKALYRLWSGDVDLCVTPQDLRLVDPSFKAGSFQRKEIFKDRFVCVVATSNPATRGGLDGETYRTSPHVCVRFGDGTISMDEQAKKQLGLDTKIIVPTVATLTKVVPGTDIIATVPERLVRDTRHLEGMKVLPCPLEIPEIVETMSWHPRADHDPSHSWFRQVMIDASAKLPPIGALAT
ncbi:LysR family transcriptional regulator [Novosphingobium mathurense]|uniref:LysR family transcriptional regulator, nod-box dependent transcriptional activator n=1 Tax=Novosphingobium mathurense TaxID=428990 RepID=A0A1U6IJF3_9SPHN|nr:LysR family transcriptional regulator [Novosphingobium mathurense]SLK08149.1 LysR family transcriptional regulator, nod-box dependent transcriptional activator [Novosphingobium mathurense]